MTNSDVAKAFLSKLEASSDHLTSTGNKLYSYSTIIAQWNGNDLIGNATKYSSTTSRHMSYIKSYVQYWTQHDVPYTTNDLIRYL